ncbi:MAG TPA: amidohydrolase family protein, partial [Vicinamibacterales bacterium]|nr:amidohydrolase family protein [Vicinamibacterales bacterium]
MRRLICLPAGSATRRFTIVRASLMALAVVSAVSTLPAQQAASAQGSGAPGPAPDVILSNGKIITVDERFSLAQAVAIRGDRIVAVGTDAEVAKLATPATRRIDLRGRAVIPGLIDNHMHLTRYGTTWQWEVRWDGIGSRAAALEKLRART